MDSREFPEHDFPRSDFCNCGIVFLEYLTISFEMLELAIHYSANYLMKLLIYRLLMFHGSGLMAKSGRSGPGA